MSPGANHRLAKRKERRRQSSGVMLGLPERRNVSDTRSTPVAVLWISRWANCRQLAASSRELKDFWAGKKAGRCCGQADPGPCEFQSPLHPRRGPNTACAPCFHFTQLL